MHTKDTEVYDLDTMRLHIEYYEDSVAMDRLMKRCDKFNLKRLNTWKDRLEDHNDFIDYKLGLKPRPEEEVKA